VVRVTALAGGIGAGKFLRGLARIVIDEELTVVVNVGDDLVIHGLHVSPDPDSVTYWLGDAFDRERGWGRRSESFRATEELAAFDPDAAWFGLGDLDLATHLFRTGLLASGMPLSGVTARVARRFGIRARLLPSSDDPVETRIDAVDHLTGVPLDLHFQDYWVRRHAADPVKGVRYVGAAEAAPAPGVLDAIRDANVVVFCPSNPVVSIGPILAVPGIRDAVERRRGSAVGVSGIVGDAPVAGMADRLMPAVGIEVSAAGVAEHYRELLSAWVLDDVDQGAIPRVESLGMRCASTDTIMTDDDRAEAVARVALDLVA
jgi:LPPG:FO 2-phospho-L-lactate transferase